MRRRSSLGWVLAAFIVPAGVGAQSVRVSDSAGDSLDPSVSVGSSRGDVLVVWQDRRPGAAGLYVRRFTSDGTPITGEVRFHPTGGLPDVAVGSDSRARVVWLEGSAVVFALLNTDGSLGRGPTVVEGNAGRPRLALGPADEANVVYEHRRLTLYHVVFRRFAADGSGPLCRTVLDNGDIVGGCPKQPDVATVADGESTVFWIDLFGFNGWHLTRAQVFSAGCQLDDRQTIICHVDRPCAVCPALAVCPTDPQLRYTFWEEARAGRPRIFSACGTILDSSPGQARCPRAVCGPDRTATVVWQDSRDGNWEIYSAQVLPDGSKVGGRDVRLTADPGQSLVPDVTLLGGEPVVVWQDDRAGNFEIFLAPPPPQPPPPPVAFVRGDANGDGPVDISDPIFTLLTLFGTGRSFPCQDAADANDDGALDLSDALFTLNFLFRDGQAIPPPFNQPGPDPTPDGLGCERYSP